MYRWRWFTGTPVVLSLVAGIFWDVRFLFVVGMLIFIIYPGLRTLAVFVQTATPFIAQSMRPHYVTFTGTGVEIVPVADDFVSDTRTVTFITVDEVLDTALSGKYVVLYLRDNSFMLIPLSSVENANDLIDAADALVAHTQEPPDSMVG